MLGFFSGVVCSTVSCSISNVSDRLPLFFSGLGLFASIKLSKW